MRVPADGILMLYEGASGRYTCYMKVPADCIHAVGDEQTGCSDKMTIRLPRLKHKPLIEEVNLPYDSLKLRFRPDPVNEFLPQIPINLG